MDLLGVKKKHISNLIDSFRGRRQDSELHFKESIFAKFVTVAQSLNIEMKVPRQCVRQEHRSNPGTSNVQDYYRQVICVPYLNSLISSLTIRFSDDDTPQYQLFNLQPASVVHLV